MLVSFGFSNEGFSLVGNYAGYIYRIVEDGNTFIATVDGERIFAGDLPGCVHACDRDALHRVETKPLVVE